MKSVVDFIRSLVSREPVVVTSAIVAAVVYVAGSLGIVIDQPSVTEIVSLLVAGFIGRRFVSPSSSAE